MIGYNTQMNKQNIFDNIVMNKETEQFNEILKRDNIRIERIVSNGQKSDDNFWYDQDEHEFVMILEGQAVIEFEDREIELKKGDCIDIESHRKHRVKCTDVTKPTIWLAIFY